MKRVLGPIVGTALIVAGIAGLLFAGVGLVVLARAEKTIANSASEQLELIDRALDATADGLRLARASLGQAADTVGSLQGMVRGVGNTIGSSLPAMDAITELLGSQLPTTIEATQTTLTSVAGSAASVDNFLAVLSSIPFLGTGRYEPKISLKLGLEGVAESLDEIPGSLRNAQRSLVATGVNLKGLQPGLEAMATSIGQIGTSLEGAATVLDQYQGVVGDMQRLFSSVGHSLPYWLRWLRLGTSLLLVWLGVAQLALITQGWELTWRHRQKQAE